MLINPEVNFENENDFKKAICKKISKMLQHKKTEQLINEYFIFTEFGLDIAVFIQRHGYSINRFFELKFYKRARQNAVGFGNGNGAGIQVDLLRLKNNKLFIAEQFIRWILYNGTIDTGTKRYVLFNNQKALQAVMGEGVVIGQQNNFNVNTLMNDAICWDVLLKLIENFLIH